MIVVVAESLPIRIGKLIPGQPNNYYSSITMAICH